MVIGDTEVLSRNSIVCRSRRLRLTGTESLNDHIVRQMIFFCRIDSDRLSYELTLQFFTIKDKLITFILMEHLQNRQPDTELSLD